MSIDRSELEPALRMAPYQELKDWASEKDLIVEGQKKESYIAALLGVDWLDEEYKSLVETIVVNNKEDNPNDQYICRIGDGTDLKESQFLRSLESSLEGNEAEFSEGELIQEGYKIRDQSDSQLNATYWTKNERYHIDPLDNIRRSTNLYATKFSLDTSEDLAFIETNNYGKHYL